MATLVHPSSAESITSQLDLLSVPPSQTSLEDGSFTEYHLISSSDFVCSQSKAKPGRTTCSCQSLATRHCKISASTCGSQEFYRAKESPKMFLGRSITKENLFLGQLPTRLVVGVVDNDAYNGVITKISFSFQSTTTSIS